jgi:hypothetical protein
MGCSLASRVIIDAAMIRGKVSEDTRAERHDQPWPLMSKDIIVAVQGTVRDSITVNIA